MDYALSQEHARAWRQVTRRAFEKWFADAGVAAAAAAKRRSSRRGRVRQAEGLAGRRGQGLEPLEQQERAIRVLVGFAAAEETQRSTSPIASRSRPGTAEQGQPAEAEKLNDFLTEVAQYAAAQKSELPLSPNLLRTLDFKPFAGTNVGQPSPGHAQLVDDLPVADEVWTMVKKAQQDLVGGAPRAQEVQRVLKDNDLREQGLGAAHQAQGRLRDQSRDSLINA